MWVTDGARDSVRLASEQALPQPGTSDPAATQEATYRKPGSAMML